MTTMAAPVSLAELVALFAGTRVPDDQPCGGGEWATQPCYSIPLAVEVCRRTDPVTVEALRNTVFGKTLVCDIDADALEILQLAHARYRQTRTQQGNRGL